MREIKFRAWDNKTNEMRDTAELSNHLFRAFKNAVQYEFMQYTGLKDKNGKEIYEGDILAMPEISKEVYWIVGWKAMRGFMHDGEDMPVGFTITSNIPQHIHPDVINLEIIGNIHENKEKLNDSKK